MTERLVVVGGDAAGMSAASQARRRRTQDELEIVAFEMGEFTSYAACGIPYLVADEVGVADDLVSRTPDEHRANGIDVRILHEVEGIDLDAAVVHARKVGDGARVTESFDHLVIATGATPRRPSLPGIDADGVFGVQTLGDGIAVRAAIDALLGPGAPPRHAVIVGGGYIGLELADALVRRGIEVALVEVAEQPMTTLDPDMGELVGDALRATGVDVHCGEEVEELEVHEGSVRAVRTSSTTLPAELVILGLGVRPNTELAAAAGIAVGDAHGIAVDDHQRTSADGVWAAGDCVETWHRVARRPVAIALGTYANKQGRVAGLNVTGGDASFPGVLGTAVAKVCRYEVARTGLTEGEAAEAGFDAVAATIDGTTRAGYLAEAAPIRVKLVVTRGMGRVLGAQIVGEEGAAKRVDVLAAAIWNEMTAEELINVDLGYAPPFSPVWDPVLIAARQAASAARDGAGG